MTERAFTVETAVGAASAATPSRSRPVGAASAAIRTLVAAALAAALLGPVRAGAAAGDAPAPDFTLPVRAGDSMTLSGLKGQVVLINFWATWCGPCRQEMPVLDQLYQRYKGLGFTLLGVNVEEDSSLADGFLRDTPVTFPILLDRQNAVSKLYDVPAMPSTVIVDRQGRVRYVHHGYQPGTENEYQDEIRRLIREKS